VDHAKSDRKVDPSATTGASLDTDLHRTKIPPDDPRLQIDRPRSRTLRRGPVMVAVLALVAVGIVAFVVAFAGPSSEAVPARQDDLGAAPAPPASGPLPDVIRNAPTSRDAGSKGASVRASGRTASSAEAPADRVRGDAEEELARARAASIFSGVDEEPSAIQAARGDGPRRLAADEGAPTARDLDRGADPNLQERKNDFLARAGVSAAASLDERVSAPRSPFEVKAGTVIPTVLLTGIKSDLPGQIVAQVRENVYDTVTGNHLLIPQGSRLLAAYDSMVVWGQERVLVCWNRLLRPDGSSISLACMPGTDLAGYSGFADRVDDHWSRIIAGALLSSFLAATAQRSQGDVTGYQPTVSQLWAGNAAGQINQAGQQITAKNLQIQPTLTVRPGFSVNVLVTRDIVIEPYGPKGAAP
jgi:type IV secretion system protein TrbI